MHAIMLLQGRTISLRLYPRSLGGQRALVKGELDLLDISGGLELVGDVRTRERMFYNTLKGRILAGLIVVL
jgi:hypothetical protein